MSFKASQKCEQTFFQTWKRSKQMMNKIKLQVYDINQQVLHRTAVSS